MAVAPAPAALPAQQQVWINMPFGTTQQAIGKLVQAYDKISVAKMDYTTNLTSYDDADPTQITALSNNLRNHGHDTTADEIDVQALGSGACFRLIFDDNTWSKRTFVIIMKPKVNNVRKVVVLEFGQEASLNPIGLVLTLGIGGLVAWINPWAGVATVVIKFCADAQISQIDFSHLVAMKKLHELNLIAFSPNFQQFQIL